MKKFVGKTQELENQIEEQNPSERVEREATEQVEEKSGQEVAEQVEEKSGQEAVQVQEKKEQEEIQTIVEAEEVTIEPVLQQQDIEVKNSKMGRVLRLEEEVKRQNELEKNRTKRIHQEQEYIDRMIQSVEANLKSTKEEQQYNEAFEEQVKLQVYRMHGISEDKLEGMEQAKSAWYQGAAFSLFFLSLVLITICGVLHGFASDICLFMAFFTALEGSLLANGKRQSAILEVVTKVLYLLLFPSMMVVFVCYELGYKEYEILVPIFVLVGIGVLLVGAVSYFTYDFYRESKKDKQKADRYIKDIEKAASKEVRLKEKALAKQEKKRTKQEEKQEKQKQKGNS